MVTGNASRAASRLPSKASTTTFNAAGAASTASKGARCGAFIRATLAAYAADFTARERALEAASDPDAIHRSRVAVRRLRSVLRTFRDALDEQWVRGLRDRLRKASDELSAARDADIVIERIRKDIAEIDVAARPRAGGIIAELEERRATAYARVAERRRDPEHAAITRDLERTIADAPLRYPERPARRLAQPVLKKAYKLLRKRARCDENPSDEQLHAVRIAAKHVRYAVEAFDPLFGRRMRAIARNVTRLQDILGEQHDSTVAVATLQAFVDNPDLAFAAGELAMVERCAVAKARKRWRKRFRRAEHTFRTKSPTAGDG